MKSSDAGAEPIIAIRDVELRLGEEQIYRSLALDIRNGEFCSILGPSGCGKSTLLRIIGDLLSVSEGEVRVAGRAPHEAWQDIAYVFQSPRLAARALALERAAMMVGGVLELARRLNVAERQLDDWMRDIGTPPDTMFFDVIDIIIESAGTRLQERHVYRR